MAVRADPGRQRKKATSRTTSAASGSKTRRSQRVGLGLGWGIVVAMGEKPNLIRRKTRRGGCGCAQLVSKTGFRLLRQFASYFDGGRCSFTLRGRARRCAQSFDDP